jgi:hypothetical protein
VTLPGLDIPDSHVWAPLACPEDGERCAGYALPERAELLARTDVHIFSKAQFEKP